MSAPRKFDAAARVRLAKLLGLLGSVHDGEALNAGRAADRLVRSLDMTWLDIVGTAPRKQTAHRNSPKPAKAPQTRFTWEEIAHQILASGRATPWEQSFCDNILRHWRGRALSPKQTETLAGIWRQRVREAA